MATRHGIASATIALLLVLVAACSDGETPGATAARTPSATSTSLTVDGVGTEPTDTAAATATTSSPERIRLLGTRTGTPTTKAPPDFQALPGATADYGELGDAVYRIAMPDNWNGELVLWAHGFRGFDNEVSVRRPREALRAVLLEQGYAWAASSYSENGYTPGIGADDTLALKRFFAAKYGEPSRTYILGASMGGNVVALSLEHFAEEYDGGLAWCGALGGIEQIDYMLSWVAVAEFVAGTEIPIGDGAAGVAAAVLGSVLPALGTPENPTLAGQQLKSVIELLTGGPRPFFEEGYAEQFELSAALLLGDANREQLASRAATNDYVTYDIAPGLGLTAEEINAGVRRFLADPDARDAERHPDAVPTTARISDPLLTLHNSGDLFVPISHEIGYFEKAVAAGTDGLLVQRVIRDGGHCEFSDAEIVRAWNDLVAWVEGGIRPAGDDIVGDLQTAGLAFTDPLRPGDPAAD